MKTFCSAKNVGSYGQPLRFLHFSVFFFPGAGPIDYVQVAILNLPHPTYTYMYTLISYSESNDIAH